jgi:hypothetical protein
MKILGASQCCYEVRLTLHPALHPEEDIQRMAEELAGAGVCTVALQEFKPWDTFDETLCSGRLYTETDLKKFAPLFEGNVTIR